MDVNGTRFHLLLGEAYWGRCFDDDGRQLGTEWNARHPALLAYDGERDELTLQPEPFRFRPAGALTLDPSIRRGAARDRYGNWYWVAPVPTAVLVWSAGSGATTRFWSTGDPVTGGPRPGPGGFAPVGPAATAPLWLAGAAVTSDHYLLVGVSDPAGLLVFDLQAGGPPVQLRWPADVPFTPFDLATRPGGGAFVLDRERRRYWELDRQFLVIVRQPPGPDGQRVFEPVSGEPSTGTPCPPAQQPTEADAVPLDGDPIAIEAAPDGTVLVLLRDGSGGPSAVRPYRDGTPAAPALPVADPATGLTVAAHDLALLPAGDPRRPQLLGRLFFADASGDQAFELTASLVDGTLGLVAAERYWPMRLFGGKALVAAGGQVWYDFAARWLPLTEQPRRRFRTGGVLITGVLDGGEPGCVWHRLLLDARLPSETAIRVASAAADEAAVLEQAPRWQPEPAPYARRDGSEQPYAVQGPYQTLELAFQQARGRYLRLRMELTGNGRATPRIRAVRAHYPRFSYLDRYLPAVYRADTRSAAFLERFLANLEGIATTIEGRIAGAQALFDPRTTPAEALDWLGRWFDLALDPAWDEPKRRLLLAHALEFFQWRGTVRGLQTALALVCEDHADPSLFTETPSACARRTRIVELYQTRVTPGVALGDPSEAPAPGPYGRWRPADGAAALDSRYQDGLRAAGVPVCDDTRFPLTVPDDPDDPDRDRRRAVWTAVARAALGFVPAAPDADLLAWRDFLARRYHRPADLNLAHELATATVTGFDQVEWPSTLPEAERALVDWYQFQATVRPARATAHRFRVLLPVSAGTRRADDPTAAMDRAALLDLARRVVELEKPAHTVFDVKFYWDAFQVGAARLGLDTLVDLGSRSPALLTGAVLGRAHLGENVLASPSAATAATRQPPIANRRHP